MLKQYLYISTAPGVSREGLDAIIDASARNNPTAGITGLLLYNGRNFMQLLEGKGEALDALMERISGDPRHSGVAIVHRGEVAERSCPEWAMKRVIIAESVAERRAALEQELPGDLDPTVRKMILNFSGLN